MIRLAVVRNWVTWPKVRAGLGTHPNQYNGKKPIIQEKTAANAEDALGITVTLADARRPLRFRKGGPTLWLFRIMSC